MINEGRRGRSCARRMCGMGVQGRGVRRTGSKSLKRNCAKQKHSSHLDTGQGGRVEAQCKLTASLYTHIRTHSPSSSRTIWRLCWWGGCSLKAQVCGG